MSLNINMKVTLTLVFCTNTNKIHTSCSSFSARDPSFLFISLVALFVFAIRIGSKRVSYKPANDCVIFNNNLDYFSSFHRQFTQLLLWCQSFFGQSCFNHFLWGILFFNVLIFLFARVSLLQDIAFFVFPFLPLRKPIWVFRQYQLRSYIILFFLLCSFWIHKTGINSFRTNNKEKEEYKKEDERNKKKIQTRVKFLDRLYHPFFF